jgi:hypothetical protein
MEELLSALAHAERLAIVRRLLEAAPCSQTDVMKSLDMPPSMKGTVSRHIARLVREGIVTRSGTTLAVLDADRTARLIAVAAELQATIATARAADARRINREVQQQSRGHAAGRPSASTDHH